MLFRSDEAIKGAIDAISDVIEKFNSTITETLSSVKAAIKDVDKTSEKGQTIQESMDVVSRMADDVKAVIHETNVILN